jgi:hypothetical protein
LIIYLFFNLFYAFPGIQVTPNVQDPKLKEKSRPAPWHPFCKRPLECVANVLLMRRECVANVLPMCCSCRLAPRHAFWKSPLYGDFICMWTRALTFENVREADRRAAT